MHFLTGRNYFVFEIAQSLIAGVAAVLLVMIAKKIFSLKAAVLTGILYSFHPGLVVYSGKIHELTLTVFLICLICYMVICSGNLSIYRVIIIGVLIGVGTLLRPIFILFLPAFAFYLISKRYASKVFIVNMLIAAALTGLVISPWICRGYRIYHRFIFITTNSAELFWRGSSVNASGTALTRGRSDIISTMDAGFKNRLFSLNEIGQYDFFKNEALAYIKSHKRNFLKMTALKFFYFWSFSPQTGLEYPAVWLYAYGAFYLFLVPGVCFAIWCMIRGCGPVDLPALGFLVLFCVLVSLAHSLYYVETRHRWMIEPILLAVSSYGFVSIKEALPFLKRTPK